MMERTPVIDRISPRPFDIGSPQGKLVCLPLDVTDGATVADLNRLLNIVNSPF